MGESLPGAPPTEKPPEDRLDSWKEIAAFLNRDATTVQRWEKREGMPVHRHLHDKAGSVYAFRSELGAWTRSRNLPAAHDNGNEAASIAPAVGSPSASAQKARTRWLFILGLVAAGAALAFCVSVWLPRTNYFWKSPLVDARLQTIADSDEVEEAAAVSRDGQFVAFLSDRDGTMDVWVTQVGSGQFHNLTRGTAPELVNPSVRTLGFTPDGAFVTFWVRKPGGAGAGDINIWAAPTLGGEPKPYLEDAAEFDWSRDGSRLVYHTPGAGDPMFVSSGLPQSPGQPIFTAPSGLHSHFPLWSLDAKYIYFVQGSLPDQLDIWRIPAAGGNAERITSHNSRVTHPVWLDRRTLLYLATDPDGSGPWLYSTDVERRIPHRLSSGLERYTSLAASADGRRLVLTLASPKSTLWRLAMRDSEVDARDAARISLTTSTGFSPRLGPDYLLYISAASASESIWKVVNGTGTELWSGAGARIFGGPAISADGKNIAFSVRQHEQTFLYTMHSDGTSARVVADSLDLQGDPSWTPDGQSITSAVNKRGVPHLMRIPANGGAPSTLVQEYSVDPAWSPDGQFVIYSGADIGTTFSLKAVTPEAAAHPLPALTLTRGARHVAFLPGTGATKLILLRGDLEHKNLWLVDLQTGTERQLTYFPADFDVRDFDISADGRAVVLERTQERADVVLMDLARR